MANNSSNQFGAVKDGEPVCEAVQTAISHVLSTVRRGRWPVSDLQDVRGAACLCH